MNLNAAFLLKSAYLRRTHSHTLLIGNLNATSPGLYCLEYLWLQPRPQTHLQLFVRSFGQFSCQSVQTLSDGTVHRQHVGQLAQRWVELIHTAGQRERRGGEDQWRTTWVSKVKELVKLNVKNMDYVQLMSLGAHPCLIYTVWLWDLFNLNCVLP